MSFLIRIYTVYYFIFDFRLKLLFVLMDISKFKDRRAHFRNSGEKGLNMSNLVMTSVDSERVIFMLL